MGDPFSKKTSSTSHTEPFTGKMAGEYNQLLQTAKSRFNNNPFASDLSNLGAWQRDTSGVQQSRAYLNNLTNNPFIASWASGQYADPTQDPTTMAAYRMGMNDIRKSFGGMMDQTNSTFAGRGFGNSSMRLNSLTKQAQDVSDQQSRFSTQFMSQAKKDNMDYTFKANELQNQWYQFLRQQGLDETQLSADEYNRQLELFKQRVGLDDKTFMEYASAVEMGKNPTTTAEQTESGGWGGSVLGALAGFYGAKAGKTAKAGTTTCFIAGTMVATPEGDKAIEDLVPGDIVYGVDMEEVEVEKIFTSMAEAVTMVTNDGGVTCTKEQLFFTDKGVFTTVEALKVGDKIANINGGYSIVEAIVPHGNDIVYDINVDTRENVFYVNGLLTIGFGGEPDEWVELG
ncbi:Hint domain-containing protein [Anaeroselena agilis]|uniref:Hint domain-containing protein n=1 Tax=Anaeroselena agilis TaxID=3063788 RepID=A0ABU3NYM0_9FIRM|nr:Hint domain-containing protein [Selenomonadales bacterium 4137-cl]